jgi:hypothetical protein
MSRIIVKSFFLMGSDAPCVFIKNFIEVLSKENVNLSSYFAIRLPVCPCLNAERIFIKLYTGIFTNTS